LELAWLPHLHSQQIPRMRNEATTEVCKFVLHTCVVCENSERRAKTCFADKRLEYYFESRQNEIENDF